MMFLPQYYCQATPGIALLIVWSLREPRHMPQNASESCKSRSIASRSFISGTTSSKWAVAPSVDMHVHPAFLQDWIQWA